MELSLFNTLGREKQIFKSIKNGEVGIYSCGPTVYWFQHIGNMRAYLFADSLRRVLEYNGYKVKHVINVTDVGHLTSDADEGEDKMEKAAVKEGKSAEEIADFYFKVFREDLKKLNIKEPWKWTKATEHIEEQIDLIKRLEEKGFTYKTSDGIYFDSAKFDKYGELAKLNIEGLEGGRRTAFGEKKNKTDFALWKFSSEGEKRQQEWDSPWGVGFPGWHIECSAMGMKYLGEHFDIHTGGEDHVPIHHTNEIAQSECATGKRFVNYWLHNAFLVNKEGEKVSKSKGGLFTISELEEKGYDALDFRYFSLLTHYRKALKFSLENLDAARNARKKMVRKVVELRREEHKGQDFSEDYGNKFLQAVNDDLNMPAAMGVMWEMLDDFNFDAKKKLKLLENFDDVLGVGVRDMKEEELEIPEEVQELVDEREKLRKAKMWKESDLFRERIREKGFVVEDKEDGPRLEKV